MIEPAHAVDGIFFSGLDIKCDNQTDLLFIGVTDGRRPGVFLTEDLVDCLFIGEEDIAIKPFLAGGQVIGAETLVAFTTGDNE